MTPGTKLGPNQFLAQSQAGKIVRIRGARTPMCSVGDAWLSSARQSVETSLDTARRSACATRNLILAFPNDLAVELQVLLYARLRREFLLRSHPCRRAHTAGQIRIVRQLTD